MELCGEVTLSKYLKTFKNSRMEEKEALPIFLKVVEAVAYMHLKGFCHRDIKLTNVMIGKNGKPKIIDFGFASTISKKKTQYCGTPSYMAPEIVKRKGYYGDKVDVWALGVVYYKMLTGNYPFGSKKIKNYF